MSIAVKRIETRREYAMLSSPPMLSSSIHRWTTLRDASALTRGVRRNTIHTAEVVSA